MQNKEKTHLKLGFQLCNVIHDGGKIRSSDVCAQINFIVIFVLKLFDKDSIRRSIHIKAVQYHG